MLGSGRKLEPGGRIILARTAARGASPMRPVYAKPNVVARVARRLAGWRPGFDVHKPVLPELGLRNKQGPSPASCSSPHRTHQGLYQRPQTCLQVRAAGPPRQAFPCSSVFPPELAALPRCLILFGSDFCHTQSHFVSFISVSLRCTHIVSASNQNRILCMHACSRPEVIHATSQAQQHHSPNARSTDHLT